MPAPAFVSSVAPCEITSTPSSALHRLLSLRGNRVVMTSRITSPAFITAPLFSPTKPTTLLPLQRVRPQPRPRCITPSARSLDSYREGMRFRNSSPQDPSAKKRPKPSQKGCVRVNGVAVKDEKAKVHRQTDTVMVNGTNYGTLDGSLEQSDNSFDSERDEAFLPRSQRDFNRERLDDGEGRRKFSRRIDGGFYSSKRYPYGK